MRIVPFLKELFEKHFVDSNSSIAGYFTYYILLSFFPFLIFIVAVISSTPLINQMQIQFNNNFVLSPINILIGDLLKEMTSEKNIGIISFSIVGTIWAASRSILAFMGGVNRIYSQKETRNIFILNIQSIIVTIVFVILLVAIIISGIFGDMLFVHLFKKVGLNYVYGNIKYLVNTAIPFILLFIVSMYIYKVSPNIKIKFKSILPGALFFSIGGILLSKGFAIYVNNFSNYTMIYGSLTGIIVFLFWLNILSNMLIIGVEINALLAEKKNKEILNKT
jgi:membrane protein